MLYVRDSAQPNLLVGCGCVLGNDGELAYFYDEHSPIRTKSGETWGHLLRVDWEYPFQKIPYKDRSANTTVLAMDEDRLAEFCKSAKLFEYKDRVLSNEDIGLAFGLEEAYPRGDSCDCPPDPAEAPNTVEEVPTLAHAAAPGCWLPRATAD
jgi:hypothetical protein